MHIMTDFDTFEVLCEENEVITVMQKGKSVLKINGVQTAMMNVKKLFIIKNCGNSVWLMAVQNSGATLELEIKEGQALVLDTFFDDNDSYLEITVKEADSYVS